MAKKEKSNKKLFIVESPTKVKTIGKYLGPEYTVVASVGHTHHLPKKDYVDFQTYALKYEIDPKKKDIIKNIVDKANDSDEIYYATDMDVEGSVIAWNLYVILSKKFKNKPHIRVNLKEITKSGVDQAIKTSYPITDPKEFNIVQAGFLRRIEDRLVGFKISPLAHVYVQEKTSCGRVQSPALRIVVEREKEIQSFVPQVYFEIFAKLFPINTTEVFTAKYAKEVLDEKIASLIVSQCNQKPPKIAKITKKQTKSNPSAPFITKTVLQAASTILGWKAQKVTQVSQSLFQLGVTTYPRTDNTIISQEAQQMLKDYTKANFTAQYIPAKLTDYNSTTAKLEHECIRPTDLNSKPILPPDESKLYELIKARFIAAGMTAATYDSVTVDITIGQHPFKAQGSTQTFEGYKKVWSYTTTTDTTLPNLDEQKTTLQIRDVFQERKETKPPSRYKGASLIEALDKMSIGKPSTMNSILETLEKREYIKYDKQTILPTDLGIRLSDFLSKYFLTIIDFDFTAKVEANQDGVMAGQLKYETVIDDFYKQLKTDLKDATIKIGTDRKDQESTTITCTTCNNNLLMKKLNKKENKFFFSCSGYLDKSCMACFSIDENGQPVSGAQKQQQEKLCDCPMEGCGGILTKRMNKQSKEIFFACSNWSKGCKATADSNGKLKEVKVLKKHGKCSRCKKGDMVERVSKSGVSFKACNRFPNCKNTESM